MMQKSSVFKVSRVAKMSEQCNICKKEVTDNQEALLCDKCKTWKHRDCVSMSQRTYERLGKSGDPWCCPGCTRPANRTTKKENTKDPTLAEIMAKLVEIDLKHEELFHKYTDIVAKYEEQVEVNRAMQTELSDIKKQLNRREQKDLNNNLIISGVPYKAEENLKDIVSTVARAMNVKLESKDITVYRIGNKNTNEIPIKVIFENPVDKVNLCASKFKKNLTTKELGFQINKKVFLNHDLTKHNLDLYKKAKIFQRDNNYKYLWIRDGKIFLRKEDNSKIILLEDTNDLKN